MPQNKRARPSRKSIVERLLRAFGTGSRVRRLLGVGAVVHRCVTPLRKHLLKTLSSPFLRPLLSAIPVVLCAAILTFILVRLLPGDPAAHLLSGMAATPQGLATMRHQLGLDVSIPKQLLRYLLALAQGNWGVSFVTGEPVRAALLQRLPATLELTLCALVLTLLLAVPLGSAAALYPGRWPDRLCLLITSAGASLPSFFIGLGLIYVLYFRLGWVPEPIGRLNALTLPPVSHTGFLLIDTLWWRQDGDGPSWRDALAHLVLPAITLAIFGIAPLARATRSGLLTTLDSDPVRTARTLGLPSRTIFRAYALAPALPTLLTSIGMVASYMLGASVAVEKVFAWPGMGTYALDALANADYAPLQGFVLCIAIVFTLLNLSIDLLLLALDPRARTRLR